MVDDRRRLIGWLLVGVQFVLLALLTAPWPSSTHPARGVAVGGWVLRGAGIALAAVGAAHLGRALTPQPVPEPDVTLVTRGAYRYVRHPIYSGLLAYAAGSMLTGLHPAHVLAAGALLLLLMVKARWEEGMLADSVVGYQDYAQRTGRFMPWVGRFACAHRSSRERAPTSRPSTAATRRAR